MQGNLGLLLFFFPIQLRETKKSEEQTKNTNYKGGSLSFLTFFFFFFFFFFCVWKEKGIVGNTFKH
jgi:hypothetical protein